MCSFYCHLLDISRYLIHNLQVLGSLPSAKPLLSETDSFQGLEAESKEQINWKTFKMVSHVPNFPGKDTVTSQIPKAKESTLDRIKVSFICADNIVGTHLLPLLKSLKLKKGLRVFCIKPRTEASKVRAVPVKEALPPRPVQIPLQVVALPREQVEVP